MSRAAPGISLLCAARSVACFAAFWPAAGARAFDPPVDSAGPLTARIEGPSSIAAVETPAPLKVRLENTGAEAIRGTVTLRAADLWRADPPGPLSFFVEAKGSAALDFTVTAGAGTPPCRYPIHAIAELEAGGKRLAAHPILIVDAQLEVPPRPRAPIDWKPFEVPRDSALALWRLPLLRAVIQVFGEEPRATPAGWTGSDERTRADVRTGAFTARGVSREGLSLHPPWFQGRAGTLIVETPLRLPEARPIRLRFATAIREHRAEAGEPPSDGVTFRVRVAPLDAPGGAAGEVVFERHSDGKSFEDAAVDLGRFAGSAVRLQLESHPGPRNDTTCDQSFWAEPTLVAGEPPAPAPFPPERSAPPRSLGSIEVGGDRYEVRLWPGRRGLLDAAIGFDGAGKSLLFRGFEARVLGDALEDPRSPAVLVEAVEEASPGETAALRVRHRFRRAEGSFDLVVELRAEASRLRADLRLENAPAPRPWSATYLEDAAAGPWSERVARVYAGPGNVIEAPGPFQLGFDGHRLSTSFAGYDFANGLSLVEAVDVPPERLDVDPRSARCSIHTPHAQARSFVPARSVWAAVKAWRQVNGLRRSAGVERLAGRFVFDLWGGRYAPAAVALRRAFRYGLTDAAVVWHNWQRWGYDYRLPDIFPPSPALGTLEELRALAEACKDHGVLFAPHDNYIDYYPDAEGFSCDRLAFTRDGRPVPAWLNEGRGAQSYRWRPDAVMPFVERNLRLIRDGLAPTAYFIDVWSSIGPHDYWTRDGQFRDRISTRDAWGRAFAWIRDFLGGGAPQISESGHDQLIGWLDGAQANHLRVGSPPRGAYSWAVWSIPCADSERIPWFDAAHHDRFILHGAGYEPRYLGGLDAREHGIYSDDYIATEVLTGHPAMVPEPFGRDVVRKYWLLHDLLRALALERIDTVELAGGDLHRQVVRWEGGGEVRVNRGKTAWAVDGHELGPFGFHARVPVPGGAVEAAIERRGGRTVEWSASPEALYVHERSEEPAKTSVESGAGTDPKVSPLPGVRTRGACRLHADGGALVVTPLPGSSRFTASWRWEELPWRLEKRSEADALAEDGRVLRRVPVEREGDRASLACEPGVFAYRLGAR